MANRATPTRQEQGEEEEEEEPPAHVPLMEASGVDDGLGRPARHARIGAVVRQAFECIWQAVAAIPVVDPCRAPSMESQQQAAMHTYLETNSLIVETCMRAYLCAEWRAGERLCLDLKMAGFFSVTTLWTAR
jgi:hypothetical protein